MNILQREENPGFWLAISVVIRGKPISSLPTKCEAFLWVQKFHCQVRNMSPPFPLHPGKSSLILGLCQPRRSREQARYEKVELVFFLGLYDTPWSKMTDDTYHCCVVDINIPSIFVFRTIIDKLLKTTNYVRKWACKLGKWFSLRFLKNVNNLKNLVTINMAYEIWEYRRNTSV